MIDMEQLNIQKLTDGRFLKPGEILEGHEQLAALAENRGGVLRRLGVAQRVFRDRQIAVWGAVVRENRITAD